MITPTRPLDLSALRVRRIGRRAGRKVFSVELLGRRLCAGTRVEIQRFLRRHHPEMLARLPDAIREAAA